MNIKTQNEFQQLVRRILGEEAEEFIQSNIENYELREAERTLLSVGIDPDELFEQTVEDIRLTERLIDNGIDPPRKLDRLSEAEFSALDDRQLETYLTAYGIDVPAMINELESKIQEKKPWYPLQWPRKWRPLEKLWLHQHAFAATLAFCLIAVGGGAGLTVVSLRDTTMDITPSQNIAQVAPTKPDVEVVAEKPQPVAVATISLTQAIPTAETKLVALVSDNEPALFYWDNLASADYQTSAFESTNHTYLDSPSSFTALTKFAAVVNSKEPPIDRTQIKEFVFARGDTLSHGMLASGLPIHLWPEITRKIGSQFHPGDKAIFYFQNDQFEQLLVIRKKKQRTIITANMNVKTVAVGKIKTQTVTGLVETSLYDALIKDLDESIVWRISVLLQHHKVPLKALPKGSTYEVKIERVLGQDGEIIRYESITSVHIDAGSKGTYSIDNNSIDNKGGYSA